MWWIALAILLLAAAIFVAAFTIPGRETPVPCDRNTDISICDGSMQKFDGHPLTGPLPRGIILLKDKPK